MRHVAERQTNMRVLISTTPAVGHIHPVVPLALAIQAAGHQVLWATGASACAGLQAQGFDVTPAGAELSDRMAEYVRRYPEGATLPPPQRPDHMFPRLFGELGMAPMVDDLLPLAQQWQPHVLLHEAAELAAPLVAAALGIPNVTHGFGAIVLPGRVAQAGLFTAPVWQEHGLEQPEFAGCYEHLYLDIYPPSLGGGAHPHVPRVQPLRPGGFVEATESPAWLSELGSRPVVYITFGTIFNGAAGDFQAAVQGVSQLDVDVVVTVGPRGDPDAFGTFASNVRVQRYVAQAALLPYCAAVVSHAGSGTSLSALSRGIPQLCLPQGADQFVNAAAVADAGAGISFPPGQATSGELREAVQALLTEPGFGTAAAAVAADIAAMPSPEQVARVVEGVAGW
jgi:UDP:flavonoid glycosyltransferase YjiC (YdhE family)